MNVGERVSSHVRELLAVLAVEGRRELLEPEGYALLEAAGIRVPQHVHVRDAERLASLDLGAFPGDRVVVKAVSPRIAHKTELGAVQVVPRTPHAVTAAFHDLNGRLADHDLRGILVCAWVPHEKDLGTELLVGVRRTPDFGPVVSLGFGGIHAEHLAHALRPERASAIFSPRVSTRADVERALEEKAFAPLVVGGLRDIAPKLPHGEFVAWIERFRELASHLDALGIEELEVNPLVLTREGPVALDVLARRGDPPEEPARPRPLDKLARLLQPRSAAVVGVSRQRNPGRIILENLVREGFDRERLLCIKPGCDEIAGVRCVPSLRELPEPVDLLVVCVDAAQVPDVLRTAIEERCAESVILIPGGLGEHHATRGVARDVHVLLQAARTTDWRGPLVNGGNCLGIRSRPGRYDTMFIPAYKLPPRGARPAPLAVVSQSGALAVAYASKLGALDPKYLISIGNQNDLTVADYLEHLQEDPELSVFAFYVEGFRAGDGLRFVEAARAVHASGRRVVLYKAGRTEQGALASASHTASVASDHAVARELCLQAGVVLADTLPEFEELVRAFCAFDGRPTSGRRLGALSNAGFECVAFADALGSLELAALSADTLGGIAALLERFHLDGVIDLRHPVDLSPILDDAAFAEAAHWLLHDPSVDLGVVGCVPLTGAMNTLAPASSHREDLTREGSIAQRLIALWNTTRKPWVTVIDAGPLYDPLAEHLAAAGLAVSRCADRALRVLQAWAGVVARVPAPRGTVRDPGETRAPARDLR